ncbi:MAG: hypothetical protein AB7D06_18540 [Pedobacter sp.]
MPRQNRVTPFGELIATNARGMFMGNRGVLHDSDGQLTSKRWTHPHWIICRLEFKGRKRTLMSPGCYTELFFTDEAVALAAGHRPCAECRREDFNRFKAAWIEGNSHLGFSSKTSIGEIDRVLQMERVNRSHRKITYQDRLGNLPDGTFFTALGSPGIFICIWQGALWRWTPESYAEFGSLGADVMVEVLTPASTVNAMKAGFVPVVSV